MTVARFGVDPDAAWAEIQSIQEDNRGIASPKAIVARARDPRNPLHPAFTWPDNEAAEKWRRYEARQLVRALRIHFEANGAPSPALVNVRLERGSRGYMNTDQALERLDLRAQVLREALKLYLALARRFSALSELAEVHGTLAEIARKLGMEDLVEPERRVA